MSSGNDLLMAAGAGAAHEIDNALVFNAAGSPFIARTLTAGTSAKEFTVFGWIKRSNLVTAQTIVAFDTGGGNTCRLEFATTDQIEVLLTTTGGTSRAAFTSADKFSDNGAWLPFLLSVNSNTASPTVYLWIGGRAITVTNTVAQDDLFGPGTNAYVFNVGADHDDANSFDGYMAQIGYQDGQSFTTYTNHFEQDDEGMWRPVNVTGLTYGTVGSLYDFAVAPGTGNGAGTDVSGLGKHGTDNNLASTDQVIDTPTNNFPTISPLPPAFTTSEATLTEGNTKAVYVSAFVAYITPYKITSGKWYFECTMSAQAGQVGVMHATGINNGIDHSANANQEGCYGVNPTSGDKGKDGSFESYGSAFTAGSVIGCAFDADNGKIYWSDDGVWMNSGDPAAGTGFAYDDLTDDFYMPYIGYGAAVTFTLNMGGTVAGFAATPPTGFLALNSTNFPIPDTPNIADLYVEALADETGIAAAIAAAHDFTNYVEIFKNRDTGSTNWFARFSHDSSNEHVWQGTNTHTTKSTFSGTDAFLAFALNGDATGIKMGSVAHTNLSDTTVTHNAGNARQTIWLFSRGAATEIFLWHCLMDSGDTNELTSAIDDAAGSEIKTQLANSFVIDGALPTGTYDYLVVAEGSGCVDHGLYVGNLADDGPYTPLGIVPHYMNRDNKDAAGQQSIYSHHLSDESNPVRSNVFFEFGSAQGSSIHDWNRLVGGCKQADNSGTSNKSGSTYWITAIGPAVAGHGGEFGDGIAPAIAR